MALLILWACVQHCGQWDVYVYLYMCIYIYIYVYKKCECKPRWSEHLCSLFLTRKSFVPSTLLIAGSMKEESCLHRIYGWEKMHSVSSCPPKSFWVAPTQHK